MAQALDVNVSRDDVVRRLETSRILFSIDRGLLWIDAERRWFRVDPVARSLLGTGVNSGPLKALSNLFNIELARSSGPKDTHAVAFATPEKRCIRMRFLCMSDGEQLFLLEDMTEIVRGEFLLQDTEKVFRGLFENATTGMFRATLSGEHTSANPALVKMMGYSTEDEWLAQSHAGMERFFVQPQRYQALMQELGERQKVVDHVSELFAQNGQTFWVSITAWIVLNSDGTPKHIDGTFIDVSERMQNFAVVKRAAETDELTGLMNRPKIYELIGEKITASGEPTAFALLLIDLDRFKDINDVYGHATGDAVLLAVSQRLSKLVGTYGAAARLGGDEFAIVYETRPGAPNLQEFGALLVQSLCQPINVNGIDHALSGSIGVSLYPEHAMDRPDLFRKADIALYKVKSSGRNNMCVFTPAFEVSRQRAHFLAQELRDAEKRGEMELHYQPIVQAGDGKIQGFEALMRWHHPKRGTVSPTEFIPIAEDAGYMTAFGSWAIREACAHIVALPKPIFVSVNVSAVQFNAVDFPNIVEAALKETGLEPSRLELEVTEGIVLRNEERTIAILNRLKKIGVSIALDDFGTGYSSFGYLQKFPFDKVKIDRSFVKNLADNRTNAALVRAVLSIGRDLGLPVVAEGVESIEQRDQLRAAGCPLFQGYLYGKPAPFSDAANNLALEALTIMDPAPVKEPDTKLTA